MQITIYRGTHEIGGTLIELKTQGSRILLDAGYPLFLNGLPIDDKLVALPPEELLKIGVLPAIAGLSISTHEKRLYISHWCKTVLPMKR